MVSTSIPKNVRHVVGPSRLWSAIGIPSVVPCTHGSRLPGIPHSEDLVQGR